MFKCIFHVLSFLFFVMVIEHVKNGSMIQFLKNCYNTLNLYNKLLKHIANELKEIHNKGFVHKDLHSDSILSYSNNFFYISDLGLCKPVNEQTKNDEKKIFGVLLYSFGILSYEILLNYNHIIIYLTSIFINFRILGMNFEKLSIKGI